MSKRVFALSWRSKVATLLMVFSVVPVVALSYWTLQALEGYFRNATLDSLEGLSRAKAQAIEQFTTDRVRQVERIATLVVSELEVIGEAPEGLPATSSGTLPDPHDVQEQTPATSAQTSDAGVDAGVDAGAAPRKDPKQQSPGGNSRRLSKRNLGEQARLAQQSLRKTLGLLQRDQGVYEEILVIDLSGEVLVSTFDAHEGKTAASIEYFQKGRRATYVQPVFLSPITERLTMVVATPIKNENQRVIGVLAARLNLDTFFRLIGDLAGLGLTGETVVARQGESRFVFMAPTRHDSDAALKREVVADAPNSRSIQEAVAGQSGSGMVTDYRNVNTFAAWQHIASLEWGLVVKIDADESREVVAEAREHVMVLMLAMIIGIVVASIMLSKAMVAPLRELKEAADKISRGDLNVKLRIRSKDEVGQLADSFERMIAAIKFFQEKDTHEEDLQGEDNP